MLAKFSIMLSAIFLFPACSSLIDGTRESLLGKSKSEEKTKKEVRWVSRDQYDELALKYKDLNDKYTNLKEQRMSNSSDFDQVSELVSPSAQSNAETVDVFGSKGLTAKPKVTTNMSSVDSELDYYKKAMTLMRAKKLDESLKIFQFLEKSQSDQLRVRSKLNISRIYFDKKQFDLSLQVAESIIREDAFSSIVLKALDVAINSSQMLGLPEKKSQYDSLLNEVFEQRG